MSTPIFIPKKGFKTTQWLWMAPCRPFIYTVIGWDVAEYSSRVCVLGQSNQVECTYCRSRYDNRTQMNNLLSWLSKWGLGFYFLCLCESLVLATWYRVIGCWYRVWVNEQGSRCLPVEKYVVLHSSWIFDLSVLFTSERFLSEAVPIMQLVLTRWCTFQNDCIHWNDLNRAGLHI